MVKKLYIPTNLKMETELFPGFGGKELKLTILFTLLIGVIHVIIFTFTKDLTIFILSMVITISILITLFTKNNLNQSVVDYIVDMISFSKTQKQYYYDNGIEKILKHYRAKALKKDKEKRQ